MNAVAISLPETAEEFIPVCTTDPERWTANPDDEAKALCRGCPLRWRCAREAWETPGSEGLWAGVVIPESVRGRGSRFGSCARWPPTAAIRCGRGIAPAAVSRFPRRSRPVAPSFGRSVGRRGSKDLRCPHQPTAPAPTGSESH